jgi:LysR family transcriptional regulator, carnitine catabolism transcriptional activator
MEMRGRARAYAAAVGMIGATMSTPTRALQTARSATARRPANVSLKQLRAFAAVAAEGSFTRAAQRLHLSQSALSALIRGLETELGLRLLDRTTRRLELTEAGFELEPTVQRLLSEIDRVALDLRDVAERRRGRVRLGTTPLLACSLMPPLVAAYRAAFPGVDALLFDASTDILLEKLRAGELDLAISTFEETGPDVVAEPLFTDPMVMVCASGHALAREPRVRWSALRDQPLLMLAPGSGLRSLVERELQKLGLPVAPAQEVTHVATALALARAGLGVAVLPAYALQVGQVPDVVGVPLVHPTIARTVSLIHLRQRSLSPAARAMQQHLVAQMGTQHGAVAPGVKRSRRKRAP